MISWLLELFLSSIPAWMWMVGAGSGLVIYFFTGILNHFPGISTYSKFFKPVAGVVTLFCVFMYGGAGVQAMWEEKVREAEKQVEVEKAKSDQLNKDLANEREKKQQVIVQYKDRIKTEIKVKKEFIDKDCKIDPAVPDLLNKAATNPFGEIK